MSSWMRMHSSLRMLSLAGTVISLLPVFSVKSPLASMFAVVALLSAMRCTDCFSADFSVWACGSEGSWVPSVMVFLLAHEAMSSIAMAIGAYLNIFFILLLFSVSVDFSVLFGAFPVLFE